jgi:hypothetical protein
MKDIMNDPRTTPCGHSFENAAIMSHLSIRKNCPNCRRKLEEKDLRKNP